MDDEFRCFRSMFRPFVVLQFVSRASTTWAAIATSWAAIATSCDVHTPIHVGCTWAAIATSCDVHGMPLPLHAMSMATTKMGNDMESTHEESYRSTDEGTRKQP